MLTLPLASRIWLCREPVDFRKAFDGLCGIVLGRLGRDPYSGEVFVFFNRRRNRIKLLVWDRNGFWLLYKRLERGTFEALPETSPSSPAVHVDRATLAMLLEGIDTKKSRFRHHFVRAIRIEGRSGRGGARHRLRDSG